MGPLDKTDWEILDATADDCEDLEQIYLSVSFVFFEGGSKQRGVYQRRERTILLSEIADRVLSLVDGGYLEPVMDEDGGPSSNLKDLSYVWRAWFNMTPEGRRVWETSEHGHSLA